MRLRRGRARRIRTTIASLNPTLSSPLMIRVRQALSHRRKQSFPTIRHDGALLRERSERRVLQRRLYEQSISALLLVERNETRNREIRKRLRRKLRLQDQQAPLERAVQVTRVKRDVEKVRTESPPERDTSFNS